MKKPIGEAGFFCIATVPGSTTEHSQVCRISEREASGWRLSKKSGECRKSSAGFQPASSKRQSGSAAILAALPLFGESRPRCKTDTRAPLIGISAFLVVLLAPNSLFAQGDSVVNQPLALLVLLAAISLAPFVLIMVTSFVKISVVLSILRQALGTQQIPPTQVINGLAIILTIYIMYPVGLEVKEQTAALFDERTNRPLMSDATTELVKQGADIGKEPLRKFLLKHTHSKDRVLFFGLAKRMRTPEQQQDLTDQDLIILVPSFVISELKEAFQIGFLIFVPFIVIDMVVSNILLAMGMMMLSPTTISLPFKLLLFILIDGWYLIARGLVLGYLPGK